MVVVVSTYKQNTEVQLLCTEFRWQIMKYIAVCLAFKRYFDEKRGNSLV
jgi:hypothetical protein